MLYDLSEDKYVKELKQRIKTGKHDTKRAIEPATIISWEKFFMRMAKHSQKRPGDFTGRAVKYFLQISNKLYSITKQGHDSNHNAYFTLFSLGRSMHSII